MCLPAHGNTTVAALTVDPHCEYTYGRPVAAGYLGYTQHLQG